MLRVAVRAIVVFRGYYGYTIIGVAALRVAVRGNRGVYTGDASLELGSSIKAYRLGLRICHISNRRY